ncbi:MAG: UDP-N-acetylmuramoyl-tripeptide--D-alanyl-D-alanine ligase [Microthrixaceae bacterium]
MDFDCEKLARDLGGELAGPGASVAGRSGAAPVVSGLSIDSRTLLGGQLFAAVSDERDGHEFVRSARDAGAGAVLVDHGVDDGWAIVVRDVPEALVRIARIARRRLPDFVVGVTGSVGKTTTKDLLGAVLSQRLSTATSEKSFNNELGVPITLANAPADTEAVVVEMGARGHGHISQLCSMAQPTVGVVTAVQAVHTQHMGTEDQIAVAKRELIESLPPNGLAVLNAADPRVAAMAGHTRASVLTFAVSEPTSAPSADVIATNMRIDDELHPSFTLESPWGSVDVTLAARGLHNVGNALAAATVGLHAELTHAEVAAGLAEPIPSPWRMELSRGPSGVVVLNDSYNAGPASMAAALKSLAALPAGHRVAVLGTMAELGDREASEHAAVAALAAQLGIEVLAVGTDLYGAEPLTDPEAAVSALESAGHNMEGTAVLVKGSRVVGLERVAHALTTEEGS